MTSAVNSEITCNVFSFATSWFPPATSLMSKGKLAVDRSDSVFADDIRSAWMQFLTALCPKQDAVRDTQVRYKEFDASSPHLKTSQR